MILTDEMWKKIEQYIPFPKRAPDGGGRPAHPRRIILEGILWVLATGARWKDLPKGFPSYKSCHRIFQEWQRQGVFEAIFQGLTTDKKEEQDFSEDISISGSIDGTFVPAKKGVHLLDEGIKAKAAPLWPSATTSVNLLDLVSMGRTRMRVSAWKTC
jgi:transposase